MNDLIEIKTNSIIDIDNSKYFGNVDGQACDFRVDILNNELNISIDLYPYWRNDLTPSQISKQRIFVSSTSLKYISCTMQIDATDWMISRCHPILWRFEESHKIICNSRANIGELISRLSKLNLPNCREIDFKSIFPMKNSEPPYSLDSIPSSLYRPIVSILRQMDVRLFLPSGEIVKEPTNEILLFSARDYFVANEFNVLIPKECII
jgi:hypothetical protein